MTIEKPNCIANKVAATELITEAQPLIPHAQGIKCALSWARLFKASGIGIPIKNANGAINKIESMNLAISGQAAVS